VTLWALRCRRGELARLTERTDEGFEPRAESPRFFIPVPDSSGAALVEMACGEIPAAGGSGAGTAAT
jgi:hypothetical protein